MQAWAMTRLARALSYARPFSFRERERERERRCHPGPV